MTTPEDKKIDFEKLQLSGDLSGSLEPIADEKADQSVAEQSPETETQTHDLLAEEGIETAQAATAEHKRAAPRSQSKFNQIVQKLRTADPFNVLLSITVAALLIAVLLCLIELGRYHFDLGAKRAKGTVSMIAPLDVPNSLG